LSKCYQASGGKLTCVTCHDPHVQPSPEEAPGYYRKKCLSCHAENSCKLPLQARLRNSPPDDCVGCHLPKREAKEVQHSVALTDHRVPATRGEPYPDAAFRETGPDTPGLIHLNPIPGNNAVSSMTLTKAYGQLAGKQFNEYRPRYLTMLNKLAKTDPDNTYTLEALAAEDMQQATADGYRDAMNKLVRAIESGSASVAAYQALSDLLVRSGQVEQAIQLLKRALKLSPYNATGYRSLADLYSFTNRPTEAVATLNQALKLFPQDTSLREALKEVQSIRSPDSAADPR
jgi:hypothetical protein